MTKPVKVKGLPAPATAKSRNRVDIVPKPTNAKCNAGPIPKKRQRPSEVDEDSDGVTILPGPPKRPAANARIQWAIHLTQARDGLEDYAVVDGKKYVSPVRCRSGNSSLMRLHRLRRPAEGHPRIPEDLTIPSDTFLELYCLLRAPETTDGHEHSNAKAALEKGNDVWHAYTQKDGIDAKSPCAHCTDAGVTCFARLSSGATGGCVACVFHGKRCEAKFWPREDVVKTS